MNRVINIIEKYIPEFTAGVVTFVVGLVLMKIILKLTKRWLKKGSTDESMHKFILNLIKIILWIVIIFATLGAANLIESASLVAVVGAIGAGLALALRDSLANVVGGVAIMFNKHFSKGDLIEDLEIMGIVEHTDIFYTTLRTFDNRVVTIPNGKLANNTVINHTRLGTRRLEFTFSVSYESDLKKAREILMKVCEKSPMILKEPEPITGVFSQTESSVKIDLKCWCKTDDYWQAKYVIEEDVKNEMVANGIVIPYNRVDVKILDKI